MDLEGDGLAEIDGRPVLVPATLPGERVEVRTGGADEHGRATADLLRVLSPSRQRVAARCRHFGDCGGCQWQHVAYPEQLRLKQGLLQALLDASLGAGAPRVEATIGTPVPTSGNGAAGADDAPWGYRNKVHFVFGPGAGGRPLVMGHYRRGTRAVVLVEECPVHARAGNRLAFAIRDALERAHVPGATADCEQGVARHVVVRVAASGDAALATLVVTENTRPLRRVTGDVRAAVEGARAAGWPARVGFHLNIHDRPGPFLFGRSTRRLFGEEHIREEVAGVSYLLSPEAFFQTNVKAAACLVTQVVEAVVPGVARRVLDLYAGAGLFALPLAMRGLAVTAVEENRDAVAAGIAALRVNRVPAPACRFLASRVEEAMPVVSGEWDVVVLDPPRQGCPPRVLRWILETLRPARIVYVSCNPEALARDLSAVPPAGYAIDRVQPVDMFPHTAHIESVATLTRCAERPATMDRGRLRQRSR